MNLARRAANRLGWIVRGRGLPIPASLADAGGPAATVPLDYQRHAVRLLATSDMERRWRARSCRKEPWTVAWLEESAREGSVVYDIGANVGTFALIAAKLCGRSGTVVAFEPGFSSYSHLCGNIVLNGCQATIIPVPLALGSASGLGRFAYRTLDPGQSRHEFSQGAWAPAEARAADRYLQPVLTMSLDEVVGTFRLPPPHHMKIDVDGGELEVLEGASGTLEAATLQSILLEVDHALTGPATALLDRRGFSLERRHERSRGEKASSHVWYGVFRRRRAASP
jgi:FkbM family methyltransferase